jgi:hypothetical protein
MSVKTMLPILGAGAAVALLGLAAARRHSLSRGTRSAERRGSGVHPRAALAGGGTEPGFAPVPLTREFWDAAPESYSFMEEHSRLEAYDSLDTEDLSAEWLARATEAPAQGAPSALDDIDDPAEIAADSLSMISDASRRAAQYDPDEPEPSSDYDLEPRSIPRA